MNAAWKSAQASAPGRTVATVRTTAQQAYNARAQRARAGRQRNHAGRVHHRRFPSAATGPSARWTTSAPTAGALIPHQAVNPPSVWYIGTDFRLAMDDEDNQYRTVTSHFEGARAAQAGPPSSFPCIKHRRCV